MALGQAVVNWLLVGSFYAAVALGFSLVWGIMNIINLAHGSFVLVGAYTAFWIFTGLHLDPFLSLPLTMLVLFILGWVVQYVAINRIVRAPVLMTFMLTFGLDLLIADLLQQFFKSDQRSINVSYSGAGLNLGATHIAFDQLIAAAIAVLLTVLLTLFLARTRTGNAILATGMDRDAARLMGISIRRIYALTFAIGAALAGAAGAMLAELKSFDPSQGGSLTLSAFVIVILGGLGTPWAVIAGGLVFGLAETVAPLVSWIGPGYNNVIAFFLLVAVLVLRPKGLLGKAFYS
jgi:branched-chain amino acid transport system permease protein